MTQAQLNRHLVALTDGLYLGNFSTGSDLLPFYLKGAEVADLDQLLSTEIVLPTHGPVAVSELVNARFLLAADESMRVNREQVISFNLTPPDSQPIGPFVEQVKAKVVETLVALDNPDVYVHYRGSADHLRAFLQDFSRILMVSLLILLVLMWFTLGAWRLAFLVIFSIPLAFAGGMLLLQMLNWVVPQNLDVITMIGFIILMGLVINNAILLAAQYDAGIKSGLAQTQAVVQAVSVRKRPIYMSTGTTILGMLPLLLSPGDGAAIYRGLAAVIIGGMSFSLLFTLSFISAALALPIFNYRKYNN
jgi:HAE1 family hydrophobic/amphiphilic exporter-1